MRIPGSISIRDAFVTANTHTSSVAATSLVQPIPFEIQTTMDFDNAFETDTFGMVGQYVIPYFTSSGVRIVAAYEVIEDITFELRLYIGHFNMFEPESIEGIEYQATRVRIEGETGDIRFVEWNITVDDKYPLGVMDDIQFIVYWANETFFSGAIKWLGPIYCLCANKARIGATVSGTPTVYTPQYFGD